MKEEKKIYILVKPAIRPEYGLSLKHGVSRTSAPMTEQEAIAFRDSCRKIGRIKYDLYELTKIDNERAI